MATDLTFVRAIGAKLGLGPWTNQLSVGDIVALLFHVVGTSRPTSMQHLKMLLASTPASTMCDLNSLTSDEERRLWAILSSYIK